MFCIDYFFKNIFQILRFDLYLFMLTFIKKLNLSKKKYFKNILVKKSK